MMTDPNEVVAEIEDAITSVKAVVDAVKKLSLDALEFDSLDGAHTWHAERMKYALDRMCRWAREAADEYNRNADAEAKRQLEREA